MRPAEPAIQRLDRRQQPRNRGIRQAVAPPLRQVRANIPRLQAAQRLRRRLLAKVHAQEIEKAGQVAAIGLNRIPRQPALMLEM